MCALGKNSLRLLLVSVLAGLLSVALPMEARAQAGPVNPEDIAGVLRTLDASGSDETATVHQTNEGHLRFLGAPQGASFAVPGANAKSVSAADLAQDFVETHAGAFGLDTDTPEVNVQAEKNRNGVTYIKLEQSYQGYPIFGASTTVQLNNSNQIVNVLSDVMRDRTALASKGNLTASLSLNEAIDAAKEDVASRYASVLVGHLESVETPTLMVYHPEVLSLNGSTRLVYKTVISAQAPVMLHEVLLVDADSGDIALRYSLLHDALNRVIFDANNSNTFPVTPARSDIPEQIGDPPNNAPTGIVDVDQAYDFFGDVYNFYETEHSYLSYDNSEAGGSPLIATVRLPVQNAFWFGGGIDQMFFGTGFTVDDVTGHEVTHGVTEYTSNLIYAGYSGAINESFSDIWGEFIDLTNGAGDDSAAVRWFMGEEIPFEKASLVENKGAVELPPGAIRYMKDPTVYGDPDRLGSPLVIDPNSFFDNGGVHINSGISNKLAYLLTDGDTFNGETVEGMGISPVADLFFGTQFILGPAADFFDLYYALGASANVLELGFEARMNIAAACRAVEIVPTSALDQENVAKNFRATPTFDSSDDPVIVLTWENPPLDDLNNILIVRSVSGFPSNLGDGILVYEGTDEAYLDEDVVDGAKYYYTLFADMIENLPVQLVACARAGDVGSPTWTESFNTVPDLLDLSGTQILYTPVGPSQGALGEPSLGSYANYEVTVQTGITSLPVPRNDSKADSYLIPFTDNGMVSYGLGYHVFPFFGQNYSVLYIAANGYVSFEPVDMGSTSNFPSVSSHFAIPRISALFADLAPNISGEIWGRNLDDRLVITWDGIPEFPLFAGDSVLPNIFQMELFYSGHIRVTYSQLASFAGDPVNAIVGLSDGRGVPVDPSAIFPDVDGVEYLIDFTDQPTTNQLLNFESINGPVIDAGELATFTAITQTTSGNIPVLYAEWDGPGGVPFGDNGNGTGTFHWQTTALDAGIYTVRVKAQDGPARAYQDVRVIVGQAMLLPEARNLSLSTGTPFEDPTLDRPVSLNSPLIADYDYFHPQLSQGTEFYGEGPSLLYWFKNRQMVTSLTNSMFVPSTFTEANDTWKFRVLPMTAQIISGDEAVSPIVTVLDLPVINSITPAFGPTIGGNTVRILGSRLNGPLSVTFNHVSVTSRRVISDNELEVVVPLHTAGVVDVAVTTVNGTGIAYNIYTYLSPGLVDMPEDINSDGKVNAMDVELVVKAVLGDKQVKGTFGTDTNDDGSTDALDVQAVVNRALYR